MPRRAKPLPEHPVYFLRATLSDFEARERGQPYRLLAVLPDSSLYELAQAITDAFSFDFDHAFGFYDNLQHPYQAKERYELFVDLEADEAAELEPDDEIAVAIAGALAAIDNDALDERIQRAVREIMQEELLAHIPSALQEQARERLPGLLDALAEEATPGLAETFAEEDEADWLEEEALGVRDSTVAEAFNQVGKKLLFLFDYGDEWRFIVKFMRAEEAQADVEYPLLVESVGEAPEQYPELEDEDEL